jgi:hypothetical protein
MKFDPKEKQLHCIGHILNLIVKEYLFRQDCSTFEKEFKKAGALKRQALWRQRREIGKLHNLVAHIIASGKRTDPVCQRFTQITQLILYSGVQ